MKELSKETWLSFIQPLQMVTIPKLNSFYRLIRIRKVGTYVWWGRLIFSLSCEEFFSISLTLWKLLAHHQTSINLFLEFQSWCLFKIPRVPRIYSQIIEDFNLAQCINLACLDKKCSFFLKKLWNCVHHSTSLAIGQTTVSQKASKVRVNISKTPDFDVKNF